MVVFKSRKLKKLKKQRKNKTIHIKYKHHRYTLKQHKHKSYRMYKSYYNVTNKLGGAIDDDVDFLTESLDVLDEIGFRIYNHDIDDKLMDEQLTDFFYAYENIETYEDKVQIIYHFNKLFINNYNYNPREYERWFKTIITRIYDEEIHYAENYDTTEESVLMQALLFDEINNSKTMIDSAN